MIDNNMLSLEEKDIIERPSSFFSVIEYKQIDMINHFLKLFKENNKQYSKCYQISNIIVDLVAYKEFIPIVKEITNHFEVNINNKDKEETFIKRLLLNKDIDCFNFFIKKLNINVEDYKEYLITSTLINKEYFFTFYEYFKNYIVDIFPLILEYVEEESIIEYFLKDKTLCLKIKNNPYLSKRFEKVIFQNNIEAF